MLRHKTLIRKVITLQREWIGVDWRRYWFKLQTYGVKIHVTVHLSSLNMSCEKTKSLPFFGSAVLVYLTALGFNDSLELCLWPSERSHSLARILLCFFFSHCSWDLCGNYYVQLHVGSTQLEQVLILQFVTGLQFTNETHRYEHW